MQDPGFTTDEIARMHEVLAEWEGHRKLSSAERRRVRSCIHQARLVCVPILGVAAIFDVAVITARGYLNKAVFYCVDIDKNNQQLFRVSDLVSRYEVFRQNRRQGLTVRHSAPIPQPPPATAE